MFRESDAFGSASGTAMPEHLAHVAYAPPASEAVLIKRVLIVEDRESNYIEALKLPGVEMLHVATLDDVRAAIPMFKPHAILSDVNFPTSASDEGRTHPQVLPMMEAALAYGAPIAFLTSTDKYGKITLKLWPDKCIGILALSPSQIAEGLARLQKHPALSEEGMHPGVNAYNTFPHYVRMAFRGEDKTLAMWSEALSHLGNLLATEQIRSRASPNLVQLASRNDIRIHVRNGALQPGLPDSLKQKR